MPRPATKRSRLISKTLETKKQNYQQDGSRNDGESTAIPGSPASDVTGTSRLVPSAHPSEIIQQLRNQTPLSKTNELAIESSPTGEHGATGSRPPTRARGYSSTLSLAGRKGDICTKIPGTPAFESSVLSNFRRRPRQASILHMMQDEDRSSDFDDDDFLGGLSPEDESTPLNLSLGKSLVIRKAVPSSPVNSSLLSSGKSSKRKRSITALHAPEPPLNLIGDGPQSPVSDHRNQERNGFVNLPEGLESPRALSETMGPPTSSPPPEFNSIDKILGSQQQPPYVDNKPAARKDSDGKTNLSTAALQDKLLPRRRQRARMRRDGNSFEVLSNSDNDSIPSTPLDDDELSYLPARRPSQHRRKQTSKPKALRVTEESAKAAKETKSKGATRNCSIRPRRMVAANPKQKYKELESTTRGPKPHEMATVDKENELTDMSSPLSSAPDTDELDSDFESLPTSSFLSEELRLQAIKFAEVDKWQMEFEDVIVSGSQANNTFH